MLTQLFSAMWNSFGNDIASAQTIKRWRAAHDFHNHTKLHPGRQKQLKDQIKERLATMDKSRRLPKDSKLVRPFGMWMGKDVAPHYIGCKPRVRYKLKLRVKHKKSFFGDTRFCRIKYVYQ